MGQEINAERFYISKKHSEEYENLKKKSGKIANYLLYFSDRSLSTEEINRLISKIYFHLVSEKNIKENIISSSFLRGTAVSACVLTVWTMLDPIPFYASILSNYLEIKLNYIDTLKIVNEMEFPSELELFFSALSLSIIVVIGRFFYKNRAYIFRRLFQKYDYNKAGAAASKEAENFRHQLYLRKDEWIRNDYIFDNLIENKLEMLLSDPVMYLGIVLSFTAYIAFLYVDFIHPGNNWILSFQHVALIVFMIRAFIVLVIFLYFSFLMSKEYVYRRFPLSQLFSKLCENILILKNTYLGIDRVEKEKLIRNFEEIALLFERYPDVALRATEYEYLLAKHESRKIAYQFRKFKFWAIHPRADTYAFLRKTLISDLVSLLTDDWHNLSRASEEDVLQDVKPLKIKTLLVLRRYVSVLLKASIPLILLLAFQQTPFRLQGDILDYVTAGSFAFAALVLLLELDPKYLDYLKSFSELIKELKSGK